VKTTREKVIIITADLEPDLTPYPRSSYLGVEIAVPKLLGVLVEHGIRGNFFATADVVERYPSLMRSLTQRGHIVGCHGYRHDYVALKRCDLLPVGGSRLPLPRLVPGIFTRRGLEGQYLLLRKATSEFHDVMGFFPSGFRAPDFSADCLTIRALERLGYAYDSSVLPGRVARVWNGAVVCNFKMAPRSTYHPSYDDIAEMGNAGILELPLTENPLMHGSPLGMGFLGLRGKSATLNAISRVPPGPYLTFLIHPYELVDLKAYYPSMDPKVAAYCGENYDSLSGLFGWLKEEGFRFCTFEDVMTARGGGTAATC
jgi:hypothetical protein